MSPAQSRARQGAQAAGCPSGCRPRTCKPGRARWGMSLHHCCGGPRRPRISVCKRLNRSRRAVYGRQGEGRRRTRRRRSVRRRGSAGPCLPTGRCQCPANFLQDSPEPVLERQRRMGIALMIRTLRWDSRVPSACSASTRVPAQSEEPLELTA